MEASVTDTPPDVAPEPAADPSPEAVRARAEQLVDGANESGNLHLSNADRKAIVDQVVALLGPMIGSLSDDDANKIVDQMIERMAELGAFSPPPASGAGQHPGPAPAPEVAAEAAAEVAATQQPPQKLTWAEKHFPNR